MSNGAPFWEALLCILGDCITSQGTEVIPNLFGSVDLILSGNPW
jgi:hypothetical protein